MRFREFAQPSLERVATNPLSSAMKEEKAPETAGAVAPRPALEVMGAARTKFASVARGLGLDPRTPVGLSNNLPSFAMGRFTGKLGDRHNGLIDLNEPLILAKWAGIQAAQVTDAEREEMMRDLEWYVAAGIGHEAAHREGRGEIEAYQVVVEVLRASGRARFASKIAFLEALLSLAEKHTLSGEKNLQKDPLQILFMTIAPAQIGTETFMNRLLSQVYGWGDDFRGRLGVEVIEDSKQLDALARKKALPNPDHRILAIPASVAEGNQKALHDLEVKGMGIFVFTDADIGRLVMLLEFAAWMGKTEFADWLAHEGVHPDSRGYFTAETCLGNKFVQAILGEIEAQQQVAVAA